MLEQSDLQAIQEIVSGTIKLIVPGMIEDGIQKTVPAMIDSKLEKQKEDILSIMDSKFEEHEQKILRKVDQKLDTQTDLLLQVVEEQTAPIKKSLDEIESYYRIRKLEDSNQSDMMKMIIALKKDVHALQAKTAQ